MSLQAKIMYDYEIEEVKQEGGLTIIPLIGYLFENHPTADPAILLYTAQEHVLTYGMNSAYPEELIVPPGYVVDVVDRNLKPEVAELDEIEEIVEEVVPQRETATKTVQQPQERRVLKTLTKVSKNPNDVNYRSVMDDIDLLGL